MAKLDLPDYYLERFVTGAEVHVHLTGSLKDFAANLHAVADQLQQHLDTHSVEKLIDPKTTPLKFSRPIKFDGGNTARVRLIETWTTGFDAAISRLYKELEDCLDDEALYKDKMKKLQMLQELEAGRWSRNAAREDSFDKESLDKLHAEVESILAKTPQAVSPFKRLDRVVCKESQGLYLGAGQRGVVLHGQVDVTQLMSHEDRHEPKTAVVWDGIMRKDPDGEEYLDFLMSTHTSPKDLELADPLPTDPLYLLQALVFDAHYPDIDTQVDGQPEQTTGTLFLDLSEDGKQLFSVGYTIGQGFHFCTCGDAGYGPHADESCLEVEDAYQIVLRLIDEGYQQDKSEPQSGPTA